MAKNRIISSLDIGTSKVTTLIGQVRDEESDKIHVVGVSSLPSRGVRKGQIVNIEEAVETISSSVEAAERMAGFNLSKMWVSVGGNHISSQNSHGVVAVTQPQGEISSEDIRRVLEAARAISLPASSEIVHVIPKNFTVDGQEGVRDPIGMTGVRLEVETHIITGTTTSIKNLSKCVTEVGCDVSGMVYSGLASGLAVLSDTECELGVILIDIGGGTTNLAMYIDGSLCYSSVLPVGAKNVTNDLAIGLRISLESAEKIKLYLSSLKPKDDELDLSSLKLPEELKTVSYKTLVEGIIRPRLNEMFQLIGAEIKKSGLGGLTPAGIVVCGGGSMTVGVTDSVKRVLSMPVRVGYPTGITGLIDDIQNPAFASSVGLLKYALRSDQDESAKGFSFPKINNMPSIDILGKVRGLLKSLLP